MSEDIKSVNEPVSTDIQEDVKIEEQPKQERKKPGPKPKAATAATDKVTESVIESSDKDEDTKTIEVPVDTLVNEIEVSDSSDLVDSAEKVDSETAVVESKDEPKKDVTKDSSPKEDVATIKNEAKFEEYIAKTAGTVKVYSFPSSTASFTNFNGLLAVKGIENNFLKVSISVPNKGRTIGYVDKYSVRKYSMK